MFFFRGVQTTFHHVFPHSIFFQGSPVHPQPTDPPPWPQAVQHHVRQPRRRLQPQDHRLRSLRNLGKHWGRPGQDDHVWDSRVHEPGGDGLQIRLAGLWYVVSILFDKYGLTTTRVKTLFETKRVKKIHKTKRTKKSFNQEIKIYPDHQGSRGDHVHTPLWGSLAILGRKPVPHHGKGGLFQPSPAHLCFIHIFCFLIFLYFLIRWFFSPLILSNLFLYILHLFQHNTLLTTHCSLSRPSLATTPWTFPTSSTCPTRGKTSSRSCWCSTPPRGTQRLRPYNTPGWQTTGYILVFFTFDGVVSSRWV